MKLISQGHVKEEESRGLDFSRRKSTTDKNNVFCTNKRSINHDENLINRKALGLISHQRVRTRASNRPTKANNPIIKINAMNLRSIITITTHL